MHGRFPDHLRFAAADQVMGLPFQPYAERGQLPDVPGVYFFIEAGDEIVYIGEAWISIRQRCRYHTKRWQLRDEAKVRIAFVECADDWMRRYVEVFAIAHLQPPLNVQHRKWPRWLNQFTAGRPRKPPAP